MLKIALSGGPHSGKTTTMEALEVAFPEIFPNSHFVKEAAVVVMKKEHDKADKDPNYEPVLPDTNYPAFQSLVLEEQLELERDVPNGTELVLSDRSLVDHIGYCRLNGMEERVAEIEEHIKVANYTFAFFCEPVGVYKQTKYRHETPEQAKDTHDAISLAYDLSRVRTVHLPAVSVEDRLDIIIDTVKQYKG